MQKVIIIGGVAAGMTVAANLNKKGENKVRVRVYERREYVSFGGCGIPFYVGGHTKNSEDLIARSVEEHRRNGIDLKTKHEVIDVDFDKKTITVKNLENNDVFKDSYDILVIATGASPVRPDFAHDSNVISAHSLSDSVKLRKIFEDEKLKDITIIGGGFIAIELSESFKDKNITIIEQDESLLKNKIDQEILNQFNNYISKKINVKTNLTVKEIIKIGDKYQVKTNKDVFAADKVIITAGFKPNTHIFKDINKINNGAIKVNSRGETSVDNVYAAGDCAAITNFITKEYQYLPFATNARKLGEVIASNILGKGDTYPGSLGSFGFRFHRLELFKTGLTEVEAKANNIDYKSVYIESYDSAKYAGNSQPISLKLICNKEGDLIGAQSIGTNKSSALRIGIVSAAIYKKMNVKELKNLDLFYSPPFTKATDIIHIAAKELIKKASI